MKKKSVLILLIEIDIVGFYFHAISGQLPRGIPTNEWRLSLPQVPEYL